jgi:hypothetical protein
VKKLIGISLVVVLMLPGCKKGEEDPFFSFSSRKGRLAGEWVVSSYNWSRNFGDTTSIILSTDSMLTYSYGDSLESQTRLRWLWSFDKKGNYESGKEEFFGPKAFVNEPDSQVPYSETTINRGTWEFTGGNGEPAKSQLALLLKEVEYSRSDQGANIILYTISAPREAAVYSLVKLTKDELKLSYNVTRSYSFYDEEEQLDIILVPRN